MYGVVLVDDERLIILNAEERTVSLLFKPLNGIAIERNRPHECHAIMGNDGVVIL